MKTLAPIAVAVCMTAGCAIAPSSTLTEFSADRAVVNVGYGVLGPSMEVAEASAGLVARDHCEALGKTNELIWSKREPRDRRTGNYVLFYACERAEDRLWDSRAVGPTTGEEIRELALPMIETTHAEARRHRR